MRRGRLGGRRRHRLHNCPGCDRRRLRRLRAAPRTEAFAFVDASAALDAEQAWPRLDYLTQERAKTWNVQAEDTYRHTEPQRNLNNLGVFVPLWCFIGQTKARRGRRASTSIERYCCCLFAVAPWPSFASLTLVDSSFFWTRATSAVSTSAGPERFHSASARSQCMAARRSLPVLLNNSPRWSCTVASLPMRSEALRRFDSARS